MRPALVLISGAVAAGKSSVASLLISKHGFERVSSGNFLRALAAARGLDVDRASLQSLGDQLDLDTDFSWLVDDVAIPVVTNSGRGRWLVDAVRKRRQVYHFRRRFDDVTHVHLSAPDNILRQRYIERLVESGSDRRAAAAEYDSAVLHSNEIEARSLLEIADIEFDTDRRSSEEIAAAIGGGIEKGTAC